MFSLKGIKKVVTNPWSQYGDSWLVSCRRSRWVVKLSPHPWAYEEEFVSRFASALGFDFVPRTGRVVDGVEDFLRLLEDDEVEKALKGEDDDGVRCELVASLYVSATPFRFCSSFPLWSRAFELGIIDGFSLALGLGDRHASNLLVGSGGRLYSVDHEERFAEGWFCQAFALCLVDHEGLVELPSEGQVVEWQEGAEWAMKRVEEGVDFAREIKRRMGVRYALKLEGGRWVVVEEPPEPLDNLSRAHANLERVIKVLRGCGR